MKQLLAVAFVFSGVVACSVEPLMPEGKGGTGGGAAGQGGGAGTSASGGTMGNAGTSGLDCGLIPPVAPCLNGPTVVECTTDATGRPYWKRSCDDATGAGGAAGAGGAGGAIGAAGAGGVSGAAGQGGASGAGGAPCVSTSSCAAGEVCTTEDGACHAAPGCNLPAACPAVCYGNCRPANDGPVCGAARCAAGMVCCNASCGICTAPNAGCTKQLCVPPAGGACTRDTDCRLDADYCTGCDCRALATGQSVPPCSGPGVRCLVDPCGGKQAACVNGACVVP